MSTVCVCAPYQPLTASSLLPPQKELFSGAAAKGGAVEGVQEGGPRWVLHCKVHNVRKQTGWCKCQTYVAIPFLAHYSLHTTVARLLLFPHALAAEELQYSCTVTSSQLGYYIIQAELSYPCSLVVTSSQLSCYILAAGLLHSCSWVVTSLQLVVKFSHLGCYILAAVLLYPSSWVATYLHLGCYIR